VTRRRSDAEQVMAAFNRLMAGDDPAAMMREAEVHKGYRLVPVGSVRWLSLEDWGANNVVSTDGHEVRLVAIGAKRPHTGAFKRLVAAIEAAGYRPVIVCPLFEMERIMRSWGWKRREVGVEFDEREEQWRPPSHWEARGGAAVSAGTGTPARASAPAGGPASRQGGSVQ
jgi:hypothetical protein